MHLVAVLACYGDPTDEITVSAMAEPKSGTVNMATLKVKSITDLDEFRSEWFERQEAEYAIGLLEDVVVQRWHLIGAEKKEKGDQGQDMTRLHKLPKSRLSGRQTARMS